MIPSRPSPPARPSRLPLRYTLGGVLLFTLAGWMCAATPPLASEVLPPHQTAVDTTGWHEPIVIRSVPHVIGGDTIRILDVTMEVVRQTFQVPVTPDSFATDTLRSYRLIEANGVPYDVVGFPGPTFRVQRGDSVRILLHNRLESYGGGHGSHGSGGDTHCLPYKASLAGRDSFPNCFHGPNTTNIHFHGFHVSPQSPADNVLLEIDPDSSFQYAFRIPWNQSPGTHWYHPHKHGSVALQVINGMAGAFIVEGGGLDSLTQANGIVERLFVVQQIDPNLNLVVGKQVRPTLINGQQSPVVTMRPGEVQRWRFVNANVQLSANYKLVFANEPGVEEPLAYAIARDGVQFAPQNYDHVPDTSLFAPGNRMDIFVQAPMTPGTHDVEKVVVSNIDRAILRQVIQQTQTQPSFLRVQVQAAAPGEVYANTLPPSLPPLPSFLANLEPTTKDTAAFVVFNETGGPGNQANPPNFFLGRSDSLHMKFNPDTTFLVMPLDSTQTWKVINTSPNGISHPFHIHINPFQVVDVSYPQGAEDPNAALYAQLKAAAASPRNAPIWMDTIALPLPDTLGNPGYIVLRQQYDDFTGKFVMHCHILGHEERGMMQILEVKQTRVAQ